MGEICSMNGGAVVFLVTTATVFLTARLSGPLDSPVHALRTVSSADDAPRNKSCACIDFFFFSLGLLGGS